MKITQIISETTAGCVATVAMPMGETQKRPKVSGLEPANKVMFGKSKKKGPYGNSLSEGKMKDLVIDLRASKDGLSDIDFKNKYGKTKQEMRKSMQDARKEQKVNEAELSEQDLILVPGQGRKMKTGFVPHGKSRVDHEVEMARSDLFSAAQNAQKVYSMIKHMSEEEGLEGWVQEKIIKANDYLNTIREYLEGKQVQGVTEGGMNWGPQDDYEQWEEALYPHGNGAATFELLRGDASTIRNILAYVKQHPEVLGREVSPETGRTVKDAIIDIRNEFPQLYQAAKQPQSVAEGAKVDRMVKHIAKSEKKLGKSKDEAENIAWATANKRGMLDNKNKKA